MTNQPTDTIALCVEYADDTAVITYLHATCPLVDLRALFPGCLAVELLRYERQCQLPTVVAFERG